MRPEPTFVVKCSAQPYSVKAGQRGPRVRGGAGRLLSKLGDLAGNVQVSRHQRSHRRTAARVAAR